MNSVGKAVLLVVSCVLFIYGLNDMVVHMKLAHDINFFLPLLFILLGLGGFASLIFPCYSMGSEKEEENHESDADTDSGSSADKSDSD